MCLLILLLFAFLGPTGRDDFIQTVFVIVEALVQHPSLVVQHHTVIIDKMMPSLADLVNSSSGWYKNIVSLACYQRATTSNSDSSVIDSLSIKHLLDNVWIQ